MKRTQLGDYDKDIEIDENDLEGEWVEHSTKVLHYQSAYADALHNRDLKKVTLDQDYAKLDSEIRKDWQKHFDSKPTEVAIKNYIILHPTYVKTERELMDLSHQVNLLLGVKNSFEHRKSALQSIVSLKISGFHSEPRNLQRDAENKRQQYKEVQKEITPKVVRRKKQG